MLFRVPVSTAPVGRSWHTLTAVSDSSLFLFGGLSEDCKPMSEKMYPLIYLYFPLEIFLLNLTYLHPSGDGWLFDVDTKKWREVEHPLKNKPRHQSIHIFRLFIQFLGFSTMWGNNKLFALSPVLLSFFICSRLWHTACVGKDSDVIVFGGSRDYILDVLTVSITEGNP